MDAFPRSAAVPTGVDPDAGVLLTRVRELRKVLSSTSPRPRTRCSHEDGECEPATWSRVSHERFVSKNASRARL